MADTKVCGVCWAKFPTNEDLAQHVAMERAVGYDLSADDDDDQPEPSR